jgi:hypothetical protein
MSKLHVDAVGINEHSGRPTMRIREADTVDSHQFFGVHQNTIEQSGNQRWRIVNVDRLP